MQNSGASGNVVEPKPRLRAMIAGWRPLAHCDRALAITVALSLSSSAFSDAFCPARLLRCAVAEFGSATIATDKASDRRKSMANPASKLRGFCPRATKWAILLPIHFFTFNDLNKLTAKRVDVHQSSENLYRTRQLTNLGTNDDAPRAFTGEQSGAPPATEANADWEREPRFPKKTGSSIGAERACDSTTFRRTGPIKLFTVAHQ